MWEELLLLSFTFSFFFFVCFSSSDFGSHAEAGKLIFIVLSILHMSYAEVLSVLCLFPYRI